MNKTTLTLIYFLLLNGAIFTQNAFSQRDESRQYKIQYDFTERVYFTYKMTCSTTIERTNSDNTKQTFNREIVVFLNYFRPSSLNNGFAEVRTIYDSVVYKYDDGKNKYKWSSAGDDKVPSCDDFMNLVFPLSGKYYFTTISPYFEIAKIESDRLDESRRDIERISSPFGQATWEKVFSDDNLIFYSDMNKNVIRAGRFAIDSTWQMRFTIPIEGIRFSCDTADVKFYLYDGKNFNIKAEMPEMYPNVDDSSCVIGISNVMLKMDPTSNSKGSWDIAVSPRGLINKVIGKFETNAIYDLINDEKITDKITTNITYEFLKTLRFAD
ncbi:MAG: hypothetical protein FWG85_01515 [Bacteroidetes bacterium]|nr:hypothetical protein [Bacteroidota bacterium]